MGFDKATSAAAAGGVTTVVDMPLSSTPVITRLHTLQKKRKAAEGKLWVDCGFYGGVTPDNTTQIKPLISAGVMGLKAFLAQPQTTDFPNFTETELRKTLPLIASHDVPLLVHAEIRSRTQKPSEQLHSIHTYSQYLSSQPRSWENRAVHRVIRLARETPARLHIVHLSSTDTLPALRDARHTGLPLTLETCPHYLYFCAEEIANGDARFKCSPPIREAENREKLWEGLKMGDIDFIASGHSPYPPEQQKTIDADFHRAHSGIPAIELSLSIVWTAARQRGFTLQDVAKWMAANPAKFIDMGQKKGKIAPGYDADLIVFDAEKRFTVTPETTPQSTPYSGHTLSGVVEKTYLSGKKIYDCGHFADKPSGEVLLNDHFR